MANVPNSHTRSYFLGHAEAGDWPAVEGKLPNRRPLHFLFGRLIAKVKPRFILIGSGDFHRLTEFSDDVMEVQPKQTRVGPSFGHRDGVLFVHHDTYQAVVMPTYTNSL